MRYIICFIFLFVQISAIHAHPFPSPTSAKPLQLDSGKALSVSMIPHLEAFCLNFKDWSEMEAELISIPRELRLQMDAVTKSATLELNITQSSCTDAYMMQFNEWEVSLETLKRETDRADKFEKQMIRWRSIAISVGVLVVGLGFFTYLQK